MIPVEEFIKSITKITYNLDNLILSPDVIIKKENFTYSLYCKKGTISLSDPNWMIIRYEETVGSNNENITIKTFAEGDMAFNKIGNLYESYNYKFLIP